ncbi:hypothetical protein [Sphaerimonospora thailandensis]|uniref:Uncharacterized protein n=1 Tax=Sphaerimonospora thailandensis TaxID=795644 RepID=A0A8J3RFV4_9ACTN|nr:hypothetical protein [Sphaerimonospora thailandensis]GIH72984.1 hypothetical protein Mth01_52370 [Sphaerimonospora thailandensis]
MKRVLFGAATLLGTGAAVARWLAARGRAPVVTKDPKESLRWLGVTINLPREEVMPDGVPPRPLSRLDVEVRAEQAPGDRGTELYARPRRAVPTGPMAILGRLRGTDPRQEVRKALRDAKSILETGEVLRPEPEPAGIHGEPSAIQKTKTALTAPKSRAASIAQPVRADRSGERRQPGLRDRVLALAARRAPGEGRL